MQQDNLELAGAWNPTLLGQDHSFPHITQLPLFSAFSLLKTMMLPQDAQPSPEWVTRASAQCVQE